MLFIDCNGMYVGAYCIRPVCRRMNRIAQTNANHRRNIAKSAQFGRMQYAPTNGAVRWLFVHCVYYEYNFQTTPKNP